MWGSWRRAVTPAAVAPAAAGEEHKVRKRFRAEMEKEEKLSQFELVPSYDEDGEERWGRRLPAEERKVKRRKEVKYVEGKYDCMRDCDWPTECHYARYEAWNEGRAEHAEGRGGYVYVGERED